MSRFLWFSVYIEGDN